MSEIKTIEKNLSNCTPVEFLVQTNKIRKAVAKWIVDTDVLEIRKRRPDGYKEITKDMPEDEVLKMRVLLKEQARKNLSAMLDAALEKHPQETMELIALMCFVDPENINDHKPTAYLKEIGEMFADKDIIDFFSSLMRLESAGILNSAKI